MMYEYFMTYEQFKKELRVNAGYHREYLDRDIRLFEKGGTYADADSLQLLRMCNMDFNGNSNYYVEEDMLCISWLNDGSLFVVHWTVRELFERYKWLGWQGALPGVKVYARICDRLVVRPYAIREKLWELDNCICHCEGEIALILCVRIGVNNEEDDPVAEVTRRMAEDWNIPEEQLLMNALNRSNKLMPAKLYDDEDGRIFHLTTQTGSRGAMAFFYPGIREWVAAKVTTDYFVGFAGDREALIQPVFTRGLPKLQSTLYDYNTFLSDRRRLTNRIYRYDTVCRRLLEVWG